MDSSDDYCPYCKKSTNFIHDTYQGTVACGSCGLVLEDRTTDQTKEYREFAEGNSSGSDRRRIGGIRNDSLDDGGLSLSISGNSSNKQTSRMMTMSTRLNSNSEDRSLWKGQKLLEKWGSLLNLQKVVLAKAEEQLRKFEAKKKSFKGRSIESIAAAILKIGSQMSDVPLNSHDLENVTGIPLKEIKSAFHEVKKYIEYIPILAPSKYCSMICAKLGLPSELTSCAVKIAENIQEKRLLDGKNPRTIASAAIYIVIQLSPDLKCSLKDVSGQSKIAENTIKNSYKEIFPRRNEIIPDWKGRAPIESLHN